MSVDRFQIYTGQPPMLPSSCIICGSASDTRSYIDFGVQVKKYGRIYFCNECFADCADTLGWVSPATAAITSSMMDGYHYANEQLREENAELRNLVDSRISELRDDLVKYGTKPEVAKKPVGRSPKPKQGTTKPDSSI